MLNNVVSTVLNITPLQYSNEGHLSFHDEDKYFRDAQARLWEYVDEVRRNGEETVISIGELADKLHVSVGFVTDVLQGAGLLVDYD